LVSSLAKCTTCEKKLLATYSVLKEAYVMNAIWREIFRRRNIQSEEYSGGEFSERIMFRAKNILAKNFPLNRNRVEEFFDEKMSDEECSNEEYSDEEYSDEE
jgi:hypothetical protein